MSDDLTSETSSISADEQPLDLIVNPSPAPGVKTTEFWLVVAANVIAVVFTTLGGLDAEWAIAIVGPLNLIYSVLRTYLKRRTSQAAAMLLLFAAGLGSMLLVGCEGLTGGVLYEPGAERPTIVIEYQPPVIEPAK